MSSNIVLSFLVLLSVLNTYSFPTITLYNAIQHSDIPACPLLRAVALNSSEPDYLKGCPYPMDPTSNDIGIIRCNLYLSQFNLLCKSTISEVPSDILTERELQTAFQDDNLQHDPCVIFGRPVMISNDSNVDTFIVEKCKTICTDIRTDDFEKICIAASYLRMVALKLQEIKRPATKAVEANVDKLNRIVAKPQFINNLAQTANVALPPQQENTNFQTQEAQSSNHGLTELSSAGNIGLQQLADIPKPVDNTVKSSENEDISKTNMNANTAMVADEKVEEVEGKTTTLEQKVLQETVPANTILKPNEIEHSQAVVPKHPISAVNAKNPEISTKPQEVDSKLTTAVKSDVPVINNDVPVVKNVAPAVNKDAPVVNKDVSVVNGEINNQDTALSSDYPEKGLDADPFGNNPPELPDNNVEAVAKHHGLTENEDEDNLSRNTYRDERTVEDDSYFFTYFMMLCVVFIFAYVGYHNKQKIIAIVVEGRRSNNGGGRGGRSRGGRRPNSANYHKLDSNLEEAVSSSTATKNSSKVIY